MIRNRSSLGRKRYQLGLREMNKMGVRVRVRECACAYTHKSFLDHNENKSFWIRGEV